MNTKYAVYLFVILLLLFIASCKTMYLPNMQNVPLFEKKGDLQATLNLTNYQVGYAPAKHVGLFLNGYYKNKGIVHLDDGKTYNYKVDAYLVEVGVGTFWRNENHSFEIYAGGGKGYGEITYGISPRYAGGASSHYNKIFIQPVIGFGNGRWKSGISARLSFLNLYDFVDYFYGTTLPTNTPYFIEPAFTLRRDIEWFRIKGQVQYSLSPGNSELYLDYSPYKSTVIGSIAIELDLNQLFGHKN